ncbi:unnamed protein product [Lampetra fluviatilis]
MALVTVQRAPSPLPADICPVDEVRATSGGDSEQLEATCCDSFLTVKGAALFIPGGNSSVGHQFSLRCHKDAEHLQQHLQAMFSHMRPEDTIMLAAHLESVHPTRVRYMTLVSTHGSRSMEEGFIMGLDFRNKDSANCTIGLVLPLLSDTMIHLDGDGGFSVTTSDRTHIFKPVSVQAMWSALQCLYKACEQARQRHYQSGSRYARWLASYARKVASEQSCLNEWNFMCDLESQRPESPALFQDTPTESVCTERQIRATLREIMAQCDLESVTSKEIRNKLEAQMGCNLKEYKGYIDNEMIIILGQMDSPSHIFDHVYLGSEWNASSIEDLKKRGVGYILNVTREIDNFFPGAFEYRNVRVYDVDSVNLRSYWNETYNFISLAKSKGSKCLVHCKMGVSRSASTVIAYAMKEYGWTLEHAYSYVKSRRGVVKPNSGFMRQLEEYQGILDASKQRHNKLWRSHSEGDISEHATDKDMDRSFAQGAIDGEGGQPAPEGEDPAEQQQQQSAPCHRQPSPQLLGTEGAGATLAPAPRPKSWSPDVCPPHVTPFQLIRTDSDPCAASPTELAGGRFDPGLPTSEPCTPTSLEMERRRAPSLSESRKRTFSFELPTIHIEDMERDALESSSDDDFHLAAEILSWEPRPSPPAAREGDDPSAAPADAAAAGTAGDPSPRRSPGARPSPLAVLAADARPLSPQTPVLGPFSPVHAALQPQTASMAVKTHRGRIDFLAVMERVRSLSEEEELTSPPLRPEMERRAAGQYAGAFRPVARRVPLNRSKEVGDEGERPSWKPVCGQVRRRAELMERRSGCPDGATEAPSSGAPGEIRRPLSLSEIASRDASFRTTTDEEDVFDTSPAATERRHRGLRHQQSIAQLQQAGLVRRTAGRWSGTGSAPYPEENEEEGGGRDAALPGGERAAQEVAPQTVASRVQKLSGGESGGGGDGEDGGDGGGGDDDDGGKASRPKMQHQTSILQLAEAGLVRKQAKELQRKMSSPLSPTAPAGFDSAAVEEAGAGGPVTAVPENDQRQSLAVVAEEHPRVVAQAGARSEPAEDSTDAPERPCVESARPPFNAGVPQDRPVLPARQPIADTSICGLGEAVSPHERSCSPDTTRATVSGAGETSVTAGEPTASAGDVNEGRSASPRGPGGPGEWYAGDTDAPGRYGEKSPPSLDKPAGGAEDGTSSRDLLTQAATSAEMTPHLPFVHAQSGDAALEFSGETVFCGSPSAESKTPTPGDQRATSRVGNVLNAGDPSAGSGAFSSEPRVAEDACAVPEVPKESPAKGAAAAAEEEKEALPRRPRSPLTSATQSCTDDVAAPAAKPAPRRRRQRSSSARQQQEPQDPGPPAQPGTQRKGSL